MLQVEDDDIITVTYRDEDDGSGAAATSYDTAVADCGGPAVSNLRVDTITDQRATIRWDTAEPGDTVVEWGTTPSLGRTTTRSALTTGHAVTLNEFADCDEVWFRISSTDTYGNTTVVDDNGTPFRFALGTVPGLYYRATFENGADGWELGGEWEVGAPQGLFGDPDSAYNNGGVLGEDLTGLGTNQGGYEPFASEIARSPILDGTNWTSTKVLFYRRLRVHRTDDASLWVFAGPGWPLYRNDGTTVTESSFSFQEADIASLVDGNPLVRFEFRMRADAANEDGGWTIDDFIVKDGSLPDYAGCSDCGTPPAFAGATSASDNDACGASGVTVSWDAAVSWGTGNGGTYNVYRGETPDFVPSAATLIASGVAGTSWDDAAAPTDRQLYYIVQAESDETCGTGPANGGVVDGNLVRVAVSETTSRPDPAEVGGVMVDLVGYAHVRLSWDPAANATSYAVYRSTTPDGGFTLLAETSETFYEDRNQGDRQDTYYYRVRAKNACGTEGP